MVLALTAQLALATCGTLQSVPQELVDEMWMVLPERQVLNPGYVLDVDRNIAVTEELMGGVLHVTFLTEGAGYRNQLGWFVFDPILLPNDSATDPQDVIVESGMLWENASFFDAGGDGTCLQTGHTLDIPFDPSWLGLKLGFFLKANGYSCAGCPTWYTLDELNMGLDDPPSHAVIVQSDLVQDSLLMGWEDLYRSSPGCDNDFNDLVLQLTATPPEIIEVIAVTNDLPLLDGDTDGDGLADAVDDFPTDPTKAIDNRYPSGSEQFTIAFEDMFPEVGDADYNDFVTIGSFHEHLNAAGELVELRGQLQLVTRGAARDASFHLRIEGAPAGSWTVDRTDWNEQPSGSENGRHLGGALDLVLFPDAKAALPPFNTAEGIPPERGSTVALTFLPDAPFSAQGMAHAPYDPYLVLASSGYDIHTLGHDPIPGSVNPPVEDGFLDANGYPWGLVFPEPWEPPAERVHIEQAYDDFGSWKTSSGSTKKTWYRGTRQRVVPIPPELLLPPL